MPKRRRVVRSLIQRLLPLRMKPRLSQKRLLKKLSRRSHHNLNQLQSQLRKRSHGSISLEPPKLRNQKRLTAASSHLSLSAMLSRSNLPPITSHQPKKIPSREDMPPFSSPVLLNKRPFSPSMRILSTLNLFMRTPNHSSSSPKTLVSELKKLLNSTRLSPVSVPSTH